MLRHLKLGASIHVVPTFLREVIEVLLVVVDVRLRVLPTYPESIVAGVGYFIQVWIKKYLQRIVLMFPASHFGQTLVKFNVLDFK